MTALVLVPLDYYECDESNGNLLDAVVDNSISAIIASLESDVQSIIDK